MRDYWSATKITSYVMPEGKESVSIPQLWIPVALTDILVFNHSYNIPYKVEGGVTTAVVQWQSIGLFTRMSQVWSLPAQVIFSSAFLSSH